MSKVVSTGLRAIFIIILAVFLIIFFGFGSVTKFIFNKLLFTPYNIVGIIMTIVTIAGGYVTRRQGHWINLLLTILSGIVSAFSYACIILSWFDINLWDIVWDYVIRPSIVTVGTILMWITASIVALMLVIFIIFCIIKLIEYIVYEKSRKSSLKQYNNESLLVNDFDTNSKSIEKHPNIISDGFKVQSLENIIKKENKSISKTLQYPNENPFEEIISYNTYYDPDFELKISNNICPLCGWYLKKRVNSKTRETFRGCSNFKYNNCTFTINDDSYLNIYKKYH